MTSLTARVAVALRSFRSLVAVAIAAAPVGTAACIPWCACNQQEPMASRAECEHLRDRFVDLELSSLASARTMTSEARANLRGQLATEALAGPVASKIDDRCEVNVTEAAFKCAVAAPTLDAWQQCLTRR